MTASKTKSSNNKTTKPINSIHIVVFACPNCGDEHEELRLCKECKSPMRVVQVIEKFGSEADEYLIRLKKEGDWDELSVRPKTHLDGGISTDEADELDKIDIKIAGEEIEEKENHVEFLEDIYPDEEEHKPATSPKEDIDWTEALEKLDEEDNSEDLEQVPEL